MRRPTDWRESHWAEPLVALPLLDERRRQVAARWEQALVYRFFKLRPPRTARLPGDARDPTAGEARRDMMAKAAYRHPQLAAVAHRHTNADGSPILPTINLTIQQPRVPAVEAKPAEAAPTPLLPRPTDSLGD